MSFARRPRMNRRGIGSAQGPAGAPVDAQDPSTWPGVVFWVDPSQSAGRTVDGGGIVTAIREKITGATLTAATNGPALLAAGINGLDCFNPDGVTQRIIFTHTELLAALTPGGNYTIYWVGHNVYEDTTRAVIGVGSSAHASARASYWGQSSSGTGRELNHSTVNDVPDAATSTLGCWRNEMAGDAKLVCWSGTATTVTARINGNWGADTLDAAHAPGTVTPNRCALFCRPDSSPDTFGKGPYGEFIVCNQKHTREQTEQFYREYFAPKWGLPQITITPPATVDTSIVDVVGIFGQSNANGQALELPPFPSGFHMWNHSILEYEPNAIEPLGPYPGTGGVTMHGIELTLARHFDDVGLTPFFFKVARSGTEISTWQEPGGVHFDILATDWPTCLTALQALYPGKTFRMHIIWWQGEAETNQAGVDPTNPIVTGYSDSIANVTAGVRALSGWSSAHLHIVRLKAGVIHAAGSLVIQAEQGEAAAAIADAHIYDLDDYPLGSDFLHAQLPMQELLGADIANGIFATIP